MTSNKIDKKIGRLHNLKSKYLPFIKMQIKIVGISLTNYHVSNANISNFV